VILYYGKIERSEKTGNCRAKQTQFAVIIWQVTTYKEISVPSVKNRPLAATPADFLHQNE
jgi:hypothetical protein